MTPKTSKSTLRRLLTAVHRDERGSASLETILLVGAIVLPILIFVIKVGWPRIRDYFATNLEDLETGATDATGH